MTLDWQHFTPWTALAGGLVLGLAAAVFVLFNGRIMGASSILGGLVRPLASQSGDTAWRLRFLAGMLLAPILVQAWAGPIPATISTSWTGLIVSGLLVGLGTRYGGGCTSGHGVCGLSRLSLRSLVATLTFMVAGFATVALLRHFLAGGVL
jgi:uncharacterized membrane protein YedE/YeeE